MPTTLDVQGSGQKRESARGHQTQVLHLPQPHLLNLTLVGAWHSSEPDSSPELRDPGQSQESPKPKVSPACKPGGSREWGQWGRDKVGVRTQGSLLQAQPWVGLSCPQNKAQTPVFASEGSLHDSGQKHLSLPSLLVGKKTTSPFNYEAAQGAPRDPRPNSRGEPSPLLPLETRPNSPGESVMQTRDPCRPWRGSLGPEHKAR